MRFTRTRRRHPDIDSEVPRATHQEGTGEEVAGEGNEQVHGRQGQGESRDDGGEGKRLAFGSQAEGGCCSGGGQAEGSGVPLGGKAEGGGQAEGSRVRLGGQAEGGGQAQGNRQAQGSRGPLGGKAEGGGQAEGDRVALRRGEAGVLALGRCGEEDDSSAQHRREEARGIPQHEFRVQVPESGDEGQGLRAKEVANRLVKPLRVAVTRGGVVESTHRVHAVAVRAGDVVASAGDTELVAFLRSSWKPIQAIALVEGYDDLLDEEVAIACASHQAEPRQLAAVRRLLTRAGASVDDLENGEQPGRPEGKLGHNCSGKHAGFLAACRAHGWPLEGYRLPDHPLQRRLLEALDGVIGEAPDGCGVPTYSMRIRDIAAVLLNVSPRIAAAMRARPELVGGQGAYDSELMRVLPGWIAKRGAEGLICAASPDGLGVALKVEDGNPRGLRPALGAFLAQVGVEAPGFGEVTLDNSRGEPVGGVEIRD